MQRVDDARELGRRDGPRDYDSDEIDSDYNSDYFGYGDSDGYDSDGSNSDDGSNTDETESSTDTPARDDDYETASATDSLRRIRIREIDYRLRAPVSFACLDRQSFYDNLQNSFNLSDLKNVLSCLNLPKSGKKADLANRLADHMVVLASAKNFKDLNSVIEKLNPRIKSCWSARQFAYYPDEALLRELLAKSKRYQFKIEPPTGYKIEKYVSDPVYLPVGSKDAVNQVIMQFKYTGPIWSYSQPKTNKQVAVLVLRIYEIKENPAEGSVKYRFSCGSKINGTSINGHTVSRSAECGDKFPIYPLKNGLVSGTNTFSFMGEFNAPYYIQIVELSHDPTAKIVIPSAKVKKAFLDRARQSDIQASSLQLSLRCPLSLVRIKTPVRFETCKHLQCMELDAWTSYSSAASTYYSRTKPCPICNSAASAAIVVDGYFKEILEETNEDVEMVTVDVENELKWSLNLASSSKESISLNPETPATMPSSPIALLNEPIVIDLSEDNTVYDTPWVQPVPVKREPALPAQHLSVLPQARPSPSAVDDGVVDLTTDSPIRPHRPPGPRGTIRSFMPVQEPEFEIIEID